MASLKNISLWTRYSINLSFRNRLVGGIPNDPDLIKAWIGANMPAKAEDDKQKLAEATLMELPKLTEEKAEGMWTTFKEDKQGLYLEGRCVKAMFKESANILRELLIQNENKTDKKEEKREGDEEEVEGSGKKAKSRFTGLKSKVAERLYVEEDKIYVKDGDNKFILKASGNEEKPIHIMTAQGPRTALKRFDYIDAPSNIIFTVRHLNDKIVDLELIKLFLEHSAWNGLGADRSQGNGLFTVQSIDPIS